MKTGFITFFLALVTVVSVQSCDFFRKVAGRPSAVEIMEKQAALMEAERKAAAQKSLEDSIAMAESLKIKPFDPSVSAPCHIVMLSKSSISFSQDLNSKYYIVVGIFSDESNVRNICEKIEACGYSYALLNCSSGAKAVGVAPCDVQQDAYETYSKIKSEKFCPADAWILVNE